MEARAEQRVHCGVRRAGDPIDDRDTQGLGIAQVGLGIGGGGRGRQDDDRLLARRMPHARHGQAVAAVIARAAGKDHPSAAGQQGF